MRILIPLALLSLAACSGDADNEAATTGPGTGLGPGQWELGPRSGLCTASDGTAAFFIEGGGGANCMAQGKVEQGEDGKLAFIPNGDGQCRIPIEDKGQSIILGDGGEACAYYCGGSATYAGRELGKNWEVERQLTDGAGDPVC
ncbi:hypothetical protein [Sphingomicrobium flavum]|uniref:hypothetical protein n=1 Tax=Sphingomicrobium flavum TaxID=1229164 RepID=UPI0021AD7A54|nr:hypothetical protein [Sphingomicrobium flavum]